MRRRVVAVAAVIGLVAAVGVTGSAVAAKTRAFTLTQLGAQIIQRGTSFQAVYKVTSSLDGSGASVQVGKVKGTAFPLSGSDTLTAYFANGVSKTLNTFKLGAPNAKGISSLTGTGKCIGGGTGVHKHEKCSYTFKGTYNTKTTITEVKATGTWTR
jgi:hypothetical protein